MMEQPLFHVTTDINADSKPAVLTICPMADVTYTPTMLHRCSPFIGSPCPWRTSYILDAKSHVD